MSTKNNSTGETMRGWAFTERGKPSAVLKLRTDLPRPTAAMLRPDEVLVKVSHVGIFQGVAKLMSILPHVNSLPWIPETDFSGVIEAVGSHVTSVQPGDPVFGGPDPKEYMRWGSRYNGMMVEYAILPAVQVVRKPANISFAAAATLPGNGCTAVQFVEKTRLKTGDRVLVTGASGGLGSLVVQTVRAVVGENGTIVGVCSAGNAELVRNLGADEVVDYKSHPLLHEHLLAQYGADPFNVIIDISGADERLYQKSPGFLTPDGTFLLGGKMSLIHGDAGGLLSLVSAVLGIQMQMCWPRVLGGIPRRGLFYSANIVHDGFVQMAELVEAGHVTGLVDSEYAMEDVIKAYDRVATGRARGKLVVKILDFST